MLNSQKNNRAQKCKQEPRAARRKIARAWAQQEWIRRAAVVTASCGVIALASLGVLTPAARAQGSRKDDVVFNAQGQPMAGATVRVCTSSATGTPCSPLANIYSDIGLTQALVNPTTTDGLGNYSFYAAPGRYMIEIDGPNITTKQIPDVILPSDPSSPTFTTITTTSGISAFSLSLSGNLTVAGSAAVTGSFTVGGNPVPSASANNNFTGLNTFTQAPIFAGTFPWTDVRSSGAACNGTTDDATPYGTTYTALKPTGGWLAICNNALFTPPSETYGSYWIINALSGSATIKSTWALADTNALECSFPQLNSPNPFFSDRPTCSVYTSGTFSPVIETSSGTAGYITDISLSNFTGTGILLAGNNNHLSDDWVENGVSGNTGAIPIQNVPNTFGFFMDRGGCSLTFNSTEPCLMIHTNSENYIDHTFMSGHGLELESTVSPSMGPNCGDSIFNQQLYENSLADGLPVSSMYTIDETGCDWIGLMFEQPNMADQMSSTTPLISVLRPTGTYQARGVAVDYPDGMQGPIFQTPATYGTFVSGADVRESGVMNALGLYGENAYHLALGSGGDVWDNAGANTSGAFVGGMSIGMEDPQTLVCTASSSGGSLAAGSYYVVAVAEDSLGRESVLSYEVGPFTLTGSTSSIACTFHASPGAVATRLYYGTSRGLGYGKYERTTSATTYTIVGTGATSQNPTQLRPQMSMAATDCLGPACNTANYPGTTTEYVGTAGCFAVGAQGCTSDTTPGDMQIAGNVTAGSGIPLVENCGATSGATQACAKTVQTKPITVFGNVTLNGAATQSLTTLPFSGAGDYSCSGSDVTTAAGIVSFNTYAAASVTVQESGGTTSDVIRYICVGF